jgi:pyruvate/2-oxoglutarate/acetoin dehydrogenase E1 component
VKRSLDIMVHTRSALSVSIGVQADITDQITKGLLDKFGEDRVIDVSGEDLKGEKR